MLDFLVKFPDLLHSAIVFGTVIMFGALGEIITEKSGNLNLGVPGIMYFGGIAGLTSTFMYENVYCANAGVEPNAALCVIMCLVASFLDKGAVQIASDFGLNEYVSQIRSEERR